jgi:hypothetical protein
LLSNGVFEIASAFQIPKAGTVIAGADHKWGGGAFPPAGGGTVGQRAGGYRADL